MRLSLGPILFYWGKQQVLEFYQQMREVDALDTIYLGETVCARRQELNANDWIALARSLTDSGKQVVVSMRVLMEAEADLRIARRLIEESGCLIECNDMGTVNLMRGRDFVGGTHLNIYNEQTLAIYFRHGMRRWVPPLESDRTMIQSLIQARPDGLETEMFAFGRLPLAYSARCFTARHYNLNKDGCQFKCMEHPEGLVVDTSDGQHFLVINGIQTMSAQTMSLLADVPELAEIGVDMLRISPQPHNTRDIVEAFAHAIRGVKQDNQPGWNRLGFSNGYLHGRPGIELVEEFPA